MRELSVSITSDQLLLYELSLAIGKSLDPRSVAHDFLQTLCARKNLVEASLWWPDPNDPGTLELLAGLPAARPRDRYLSNQHPYVRLVAKGKADTLTFGAPEFEQIMATLADDIPVEACAVFPLAGQGLLTLFAPRSAELSFLRTPTTNDLIDRLAVAIQGGMAHSALSRASANHKAAPPMVLDNDATPRLHAVVHALPDLVWLKDAEGRYLACNNRFERFFGAREHEIVGKSDYDFVDSETADFFREKDRLAIESGRPSINEEWITFADDGHSELLETTKTPMFDAGGRLIGVLGIGHDITERKQEEERSQANEARSRHLASMLRLMCDNVPDMIWAKDLNKNYLFANKAMCTRLLAARDVREPLGKSDLFFAQREREQHPDNPNWHTFDEQCRNSDAITLELGKPTVFIEQGYFQGKFVCLEVHKAPFIDADGKIIGTIGSARDITERQRIEHELEEHRMHLEELVQQRTNELLAAETRATRILESAADGLFGVDPEGRITFINPAACQMLGYAKEDIIGQSAHALFHHHHTDGSPYSVDACPAHRALQSGEPLRSDSEVYWHADGHPVPIMFALHPTQDAEQNTGAVVSVVDITVQRAAAQAREQALIAAENLARIKSQFLANMSHEIRTPLNGILGFAQIGNRHHVDSVKARNAFEKILHSGNRLLDIVNDVLDFSKIEAGKLCIDQELAHLDAVLDQTIDLIAERLYAKHLTLVDERSPTLPKTFVGDALRLEQVLLNLLSNAVKFTERGEIRLSAWQDGDWLCFRVTDTGIGIAENELEQVFDPFHQSDGTASRRFEGTGLGLAISRHLLDLMGGAITVSSQLGNGSRFEFRIPYRPETKNAVPEDTPAPIKRQKPLAGIAILAVEDDPISALMLEHNLMEDGATVVVANSGRKAIEHIQHDGPERFDLILMDIEMPTMNGYEAARKIGQLAPQLPIIGQSAHVAGNEDEQCQAAGMVAYITKPIDFEALNQRILEQINRQKSPEDR